MSCSALCLVLAASALALAAEKEADTPFCRIFDTVTIAKQAPSAEAVAKREGWKQVPDKGLTHKFAGDVALVNDKLTILLTREAGLVNVYSVTAAGLRRRVGAAIFCPAHWAAMTFPPESFAIVENTPGAVMVEPIRGNEPLFARFRLTTGEAILEIRPITEGAGTLLLDSEDRYAVLPEFFANDVVLDTRSGSWVALPVESQFLRLFDGGDAIQIVVSQAPQPKVFLGPSTIYLTKGKSIWLAFLEGKRIWHARAAGAEDDWKPPFPAKWRCSVAGEDGLAISYDYEKGPPPGVTLPDGPTIIYPIDRTKATPLTTILPIDVMRNTLGVGPCQYVLQAEGLATETNPTPEQVSHWVERQFERKKDRNKATALEIMDRLARMADHVGQVQGRIGQYAYSARQLRKVVQKHAGDEGAPRCLAILDHLDQAAAMKGDEPKAAKQLGDAIVALIGRENALEKCQKLGEQIRAIGSAQDAALARCRLHVRRLRAQCASRPDAALSKELAPLVERILQRK